MTSRRPMTRSYSGNGRTSSFSEEEGSSSNGRSESRNTYLSNVRPENSYSRYSHYRPTRSTLCSVMAQLTEDIQPSFETTLKSKAVSENCNVKFTCVVSGYPAPELKWYKDDTEMDRYCGLPKYEIRRNGKTHTLHIYNCTLDDAAIYQVSASNSKGIVSCSGVLEVGTMNEYQIHQRFFAKLKQKAEKKRKDTEEHSKKQVKEDIHKEKPQVSPERPQRKRPIIMEPKQTQAVKEPEVVEQLGSEPNGVTAEAKETNPVASPCLSQEKELQPSVDVLATKKMKITNNTDGVNSSNSRNHVMENGGENCYDGGISLAQFLAETLHSQAAEEIQSSSRLENSKETEKTTVNVADEREREKERQQNEREEEKAPEEEHEREKEFTVEREKEIERLLEMVETAENQRHGSEVKHHKKGHRDHDHHNIQASISSMLHTVKDFFFGKGKKDPREHIEKKEKEFDHSLSQTPPPSYWLQPEHRGEVDKPPGDEVVPMETELQMPEAIEHQSVPLELETAQEQKCKDSVPHADPPPAHESHRESKEEPAVHSVKEAETLVQAIEVETESSGPGEEVASSALLTEQAEEKDSLMVLLPHPQEPDCLAVSPQPVEVEESTPSEVVSVSPQGQAASEEERLPPTANLRCLVDSGSPSYSVISPTDSHGACNASTETSQGGESADKRAGDMEVDSSYNQLCLEKKSEVKSTEEACTDINGSEKTDLTTRSLEEKTETRESIPADQTFSPQSTTQMHSSRGAKEEVECFSQKNHVELSPTLDPEMSDLKTQQECVTTIADDSKEEEQRATTSQIRPSEEKEGDVTRCNNLQTQEVSENVNTEAGNTEEKGENCNVNVEALVESKSLSVTKYKEDNASVLQEPVDVAREEKPTEEVPQVEILLCSVGATDLTLADSNTYEHLTIPNTEIIQPELKEFTVPLTILALSKTESEPTLLQKHDATAIINSVAESSDLFPTQKSMKNDSDLPPTEKVKEIAQLNDETGMFVPAVKSSEQLPQVVNTSIPIINVSCTDDKEEDVNTCDSDAPQRLETPAVPVFVVPPISVTCHESDGEVRNLVECRQTERETSAERSRGTEHRVVKDMTAKPEQTEKDGEKPEGRKRPISSSKAHEALTQMAEVKSISKTPGDTTAEVQKTIPPKEPKTENSVSVEDLLRNRSSVERLSTKPPTSPASLRKFVSKVAPDSEMEVMTSVPVITVDDRQSDRVDDDLSGGSTPTSSLSCESSPRLKRRDSLSLIRSATPEELASGARRKIFLTKSKEDGDGAGSLDAQSKRESPYMSPSQTRRAALLQPPTGQNTPPMERRSPLVCRRKATLDVPKVVEQTQTEEKPAEKKFDPLKAPQVIRKIRGEPFPDASGHLKLWCQFFNVLSDSTIKWFRDEEEILEVKRSGGDESQVALAIVLASSQDCGVYGCTIQNEYGTDTTDFLLSVDILSEILLKDDFEVGEEIEMTPLLFNKGLANSGSWGDKYFGRIMTETVHIGEGCVHKASRVKVIYGLSPVFESGSNCIVKVQNPIAYGTKQESNLAERNVEITKQECKVQNMIREYCKIFAAEARDIDNFGASIEVIPQYLMYRPANSVPFATVEADLSGVFLKYCMTDPKGRLITRSVSEVEQKCCTFQHWIYQWTHGNLLVTRLEGVGMKITNINVVTKSKGYQGLTDSASPEVLEQFVAHHQCNYYCGLIGLRPLKTADSLQQPTKVKGSRSPLLNRKLGQGSCSPQLQRKGQSPQMSRKANCSPKVVRKVQETGDNKSGSNEKPTEPHDSLETR